MRSPHHLDSIRCDHDFLGTYIGPWSNSFSSASFVSLDPDFISHQSADSAEDAPANYPVPRPGAKIEFRDIGVQKYQILVHFMRCFSSIETGNRHKLKTAQLQRGLNCDREKITFKAFYDKKELTLIERRFGILLNFFPKEQPAGHFVVMSLTDKLHYMPAEELESGWRKYGILPAGLFSGIAQFQLQICEFIDVWESDWSKTMVAIEEMVSIQVCAFVVASEVSPLTFSA